ncbi:hypothetical protein ACWDYJ_31710 [Streptomyces sp. NPDC003042]
MMDAVIVNAGQMQRYYTRETVVGDGRRPARMPLKKAQEQAVSRPGAGWAADWALSGWWRGRTADLPPRRGDHLPGPGGRLRRGARCGAADALQVADRFHLWQGLGRAVETCVAAHRDCLRNPSPSGMLLEATRLASGRPQDDSVPAGRRAERKKAAHALVHGLLAQGHSRRAIARHLGWGLNTVLRYANAARWQDTIRDNRPRPSRLDPYKPYLERRFAAGCTSVTLLHSELVADNAPVTYQMVRARIATLRGDPAGAPPRPPTVRQVTGWLTRHPTVLSEDDRASLKDVLARCPELDMAAGHVRDFGEMLSDRLGARLPAWIDAVDASQLPGLTGFAPPAPGPRRRDSRAHSRLELGQHRGRREPHQEDQAAALRSSRIRTSPQDDPASVTLRDDSPRSVPEPSFRSTHWPMLGVCGSGRCCPFPVKVSGAVLIGEVTGSRQT